MQLAITDSVCTFLIQRQSALIASIRVLLGRSCTTARVESAEDVFQNLFLAIQTKHCKAKPTEFDESVERKPTPESLARAEACRAKCFPDVRTTVSAYVCGMVFGVIKAAIGRRVAMLGLPDVEDDVDPAAHAIQVERIRRVRDALGALPDHERLMIQLNYGLGDNQQLARSMIAEVTGRTEGAVGGLLYRAKAHLRELLADEGQP